VGERRRGSRIGPGRASLVVGLWCLLALPVRPAHAAPDPLGALRDLGQTPLDLAGNAVGAAGLTGASLLGLTGDVVSEIDDNRVTRPVLRGVLSGAVHRIAYGLSWSSTRFLELARREDIERLPEASATYLEAEKGAGRLDTFTTGLGCLWLAVGDVIAAPALVLLRASGASGTADGIQAGRDNARTRILGPPPLPLAPPETGGVGPGGRAQ
jgi:hypothetical protein